MSGEARSSTSTSTWRHRELLSLRLLDSGSTTVIEVEGELDISTTHLLVEGVDRVLESRSPAVVVLDLAALDFFYADGVRALLRVQEAVTARTARLTLRDPSPITEKVLALTGSGDAFTVTGGAVAGAVRTRGRPD